jgi:hypothetical protein
LDLPSTYFPPSGGQPAKLDAFAFDVTVDTTVSPPGLRFDVFLPIGGNVDLPIPGPTTAWVFHAKFDGKLEAGTSATLRPPSTMEITSNAQVSGEAKLVIEGHPSSPFILFGKAGGAGLKLPRWMARSAFASTGTV